MQIQHKIDDFLFSLFPKIDRNTESLRRVLEDYYTYGPYKPKVVVEGDTVTINIDIPSIVFQESDYRKAVSLCEKGKYDEAKSILKELIKKNPTNSEYHRLYGQLLSEEGDQEEAINSLIDALRWDPSNGWALLMMGNIFTRYKNDAETAIKYYDQALISAPTDYITVNNIGAALMQQGKMTDAKKYFAKALEINSNYPNTNLAMAMIASIEESWAAAFKCFIEAGDTTNIISRIDKSEIRPSKALAESMASMLKGNQEFIMIDSQKIVYENAIALAAKSSKSKKNVLIVSGGPGTGKSVIAVNLLVALTKKGLVVQYTTRNSAPRDVYENKLTGSLKKTVISSMFKGSGSYVSSRANEFDALIVDEAHRLNLKSGMFRNKGENQIKEIISASKFSVFFIDEDQRVTIHDIGEIKEIERWATSYKANVKHLELTSQFRCSGSNGYLAWLDDVLGIRETANKELDRTEYDFQIFDSPSKLRDVIFEKNKEANKARLVAGYCWDWKSKKHPHVMDIVIPGYDFQMQWNLASDKNLWIVNPESVTEVGCIHTCQGLEVEYIGVIVGEDLIYRNGCLQVDPSKRSKMDSSIKGYKTLLRENPDETKELLDAIIKNTYRTLMTRGMKGCYVYFVDKETESYFRSRLMAPKRKRKKKEVLQA